MISAVDWVPCAALRRVPLRFELSPEELEQLQEQAREEEEELAGGAVAAAAAAAEDEEEAEPEPEDAEMMEDEAASMENGVDASGLPAELRMDEYDEEDNGLSLLTAGEWSHPEEDPHLAEGEENDEGSDAEENVIEPHDMVILSAHTDEEQSLLEVNCYDPIRGNLWVHHDIPLVAFPLCTTFLDCPPSLTLAEQGASGAYVAVGTFKPGIEIWNLDVLDPLEPSAMLGGEAATPPPEADGRAGGAAGGKKKKKKKPGRKLAAPALAPDSHTDAVMSVDWNRLQRQILASGSADNTIKLWDVTTQQCSHTATFHGGKVEAVQWHPHEATVLASGSYDHSLGVVDVRSPAAAARLPTTADVEDIAWDPHRPSNLVAATEDGLLRCYDVRVATTALWTLAAHPGEPVSAVAFAPRVPGLFASASTDKTVRVWDSGMPTGEAAAAAGEPICVAQKTMGVGKLFTLTWSRGEAPWSLVCGGSKGLLALWELDEQEALIQRCGARLLPPAPASAGVVGLVAPPPVPPSAMGAGLAMEDAAMEPGEAPPAGLMAAGAAGGGGRRKRKSGKGKKK